MRVSLGYFLVIATVLLLFEITLFANASSGWRAFKLGPQETLSDQSFSVDELSFERIGDVKAALKIRNIGTKNERVAVNIAFFDAERNLLICASVTPPLLEPQGMHLRTLEFPGSGEVFKEIRFYQLSIVERFER